MKIVTWNCNGALRSKFQFLSQFDADIYVIQECENPLESNHPEYTIWAKNHLWVGDSKHKGLGIFAKEEITLDRLNWSNIYEGSPFKHFLTCRVNSDFDLIAVWTHYNKSPTYSYIGQFWRYLQLHKFKFNECLITRDFNSNSIWDKPNRIFNHTEVVKELQQLNIESCYHHHTNETQGNESLPTFFLHKNLNKPYHIDYIFRSSMFKNKLQNLELGKAEDWIKHSDHLPVIAQFSS